MTTISSLEFENNTDKVLRDSNDEPVFILEDDKTTHVLLSIEEYQRINNKKGIVEPLSMK